MKRSTIAKEALDQVIPPTAAEREARLLELAKQKVVSVEQIGGPPPGKDRVTFMLSDEVMDRARNAVYWERLRMSEFVEEAIDEAVKHLEKKGGKPFPRRDEEVKRGRPLKRS